MHKTKLKLTTISPVINYYKEKSPVFFAKNKNLIYFLNRQKLEEVLFLLGFRDKFIQYIKFQENNNISSWLKERKLFSTEFLIEMSDFAIHFAKKENIHCIQSFISNILDNFIKTGLRNVLLIDYLDKNDLKINHYVKNLLKFFSTKNVLKPEDKSLQFFVNCLFEVEKENITKNLTPFFKVRAEVEYDRKNSDYFDIEKIAEKTFETYYECLRAGAQFQIVLSSDKEIETDKYILLSEKINTLRIDIEERLLRHKTAENKNKKKVLRDLTQANMSFLSLNQLLYLFLNEENKLLLNKFLGCKVEEFLFRFVKEENGALNYLNYAKIEVEE